MLVLRSPKRDEAVALTDLCIRAKAVWGYDATFMAACRDDLTITPFALAQADMRVAEFNGRAVGVVALKFTGDVALLEKLFVEPSMQRIGTGRKLFAWARATATAHGASTLVIESDPQALGFYRCMGAIDDGNVASTAIAGRFIPRVKLIL